MRKRVKFNGVWINAVVIKENNVLVYKNHYCEHCGKRIPWCKWHEYYEIPKNMRGHVGYKNSPFHKNHKLGFKKGYIPWNIGLTKETDKQIRKIANNLESNHKKSLTKQGKNNPMYGVRPWNYGLTFKDDNRIPHGENHPMFGDKHKGGYTKGHKLCSLEKNSNWKGGISFEPYCKKFNNSLKRAVRKRDHYTCQRCGKKQKKHGKKLCVHHIHFDKENCYPDLISLCKSCHTIINYKRKSSEIQFMKILKERNLLNWEPNFNIT